MTGKKKNIIVFIMSLVVVGLLVACFFIPVAPSAAYELRELQIEKTKLSIELLKRNLSKDVLTVNDLDAIYSCVDTKIKNQHSEINFPCTSVRGDSI